MALERKSKKLKMDIKTKMDTASGDIKEKLETIADRLEVGLAAIVQQFTAFDGPIKDAAEQIAMTFENFDKRTNTIAKELREEFVVQNKDITAKLDNLCTNLENYSTQLIGTNSTQIDESRSLQESLCRVSLLIISLNDSLKILEGILQPKKKKGSDQIVDLTNESLVEFSRQYGLINKNLEELFKNTGNILTQVAANIRKQSEISITVDKNTRYLCDNVFSMKGSFDVLEKAMDKVIKSEEQMAEQSKQFAQFSQNVESLMIQLVEGFQDIKKQNELLVKQNKILSDHLKLITKPKKGRSNTETKKSASHKKKGGKIDKIH